MTRWLPLALVPLLLAGCNPVATPSLETGNGGPGVDVSRYELKTEPATGMGVAEVRKSKETDVVVAGRIGGTAEPIGKTSAIFHLADLKLPITEGCDTPWDFCEVPDKELKASRITVKLVDENGKTVPASVAELFKVKPLSVVVVKGKAQRDDYGNVTVLATGIYVRER